MYIVTIQAEVADPLRPEQMRTLIGMEMKIEHQTALALHSNFGYVKIINVEVLPTYDASGDSVSDVPKSL